MLGALGAAVIDTDLIARRLTLADGAAMAAIRSTFGADFVAADGSLDRARMRAPRSAIPSARHRLEAILHPLIGVEVEREAAAGGAAPALVFDVPLLVESGRWRARVDRVWLVDCDEKVQLERVVARPGWSEATARSVIAQQASRPARRGAADAVLDNTRTSLAELADSVRQLWQATVQDRS